MAAYYVVCDDDCRYEGMTKEQILTVIQQALENGHISDPDGAVISRLKEINKGGAARVWVGTEAEYNALSPAPTAQKLAVRMSADGVLYVCTDDSTLADYEKHTQDKENPHGVTLEQVLGGTDEATAKAARDAIGAVAKSGDTVTGDLILQPTTDKTIRLGVRRIPSDGKTYAAVLYIGATGICQLAYLINGVTENSISFTSAQTQFGKPLAIGSGGHGATTADGACENIGAVKKAGDTMTGALMFSTAALGKQTLKNMGIEIQRGTCDNVNSSGVQIEFAEEFSGIPTVVATGGSEVTSVRARDITTTGFRLVSGLDNNDAVQWVAIYTAF